MTDTNGWKKTAGAFVSGGVVAAIALLVTFLLTLGGERQRVLSHLATTEPMIGTANLHFNDAQSHLSETENNTLAVLPIKFTQVEARLQAIEELQREMNKKLDYELRSK
jgi:uncharacterized membrane-anchored protein YhcB (DUF1043 family)